MANLRPGQRAKKVRGKYNIGLIGIVSDIGESDHGIEYDALIIVEGYGEATDIEGFTVEFCPGECVWFRQEDWEPMKDIFNPAEEREEELEPELVLK